MRQLIIWGILTACLGLSGCSTLNLQRTVYDFMYNQNCLEQTGYRDDCDPNRMTYDEYQQARLIYLSSAN
jgi:hypothetical protein